MSPPLVRVVRGTPTDEEIAALTVALLGLVAGGTPPGSGPAPGAPAGDAVGGTSGSAQGAVGWAPAAGYRAPGAWTSR